MREIKAQIRFYKARRDIFQYGRFYRSNRSIFNDESTYFYLVSSEKDKALLGFFQALVHPALKEDKIYIQGLKEGIYTFRNKEEKHNLKKFGGLINYVSPIRIKLNGMIHNLISRVYKLKSEIEVYTVNSEMLKWSGIRLNSQFTGTGFGNKVRVLGDFGSRIYLIEKNN